MPLIVIGLLIAALVGGSVVANVTVRPGNPSTPSVKSEKTVVLPTPTSTPTPTIVAQPQTVRQTNPLIDCTGPDGGHLRITQKECDDFNNAWKKPQQQNNNPSNQSNNIYQPRGSIQTSSPSEPTITCVLSYGTYQLTQASCDSFKSSNKPSSDLIDCFVYSPCTGQSNTYRTTQSICDYFHRATDNLCNSQAPATETIPDNSYSNQVERCQSDVRYKYTGLLQSCNQYGGSARDACITTYTTQRQREYDACG